MSRHAMSGVVAALLAAALVPHALAQKTFEFEDGVLAGPAVEKELQGFSGSGYVAGFKNPTDKVTIKLSADKRGVYDMTLKYAATSGDKKTSMVLNGVTNEISLPATKGWANVTGGQVLLEEGENKVDFVSSWGWYYLDAITLEPTKPRPPHKVTAKLANAKASPEAQTLYKYLVSIYGKKMLSGQQDLKFAEFVQTTTGKTPALVAVDMIQYSPAFTERQQKPQPAVEDAIKHHKAGGIVSVIWHWIAPALLTDNDQNKWWSGFYTKATTFDVAAATEETHEHYKLLVRDIDVIAEQLKRLQKEGVPVLWRPLHEAEGAWFWWGAKGAEPAKKLYRLMYERLTNHHGLTNLIWVWNSLDKAWYPGDDVVDILSADVYAQGNGPMASQYNQLVDLGKDQKLIAAAEVGAAPKPDLLQAYRADWLWFCVWENTFINNATWNPPDLLKKIYNDEYVLTLDEIQGWAKSVS